MVAEAAGHEAQRTTRPSHIYSVDARQEKTSKAYPLGPAKTYILRGTRGPLQLKPGL